jgi:hypothetical protein
MIDDMPTGHLATSDTSGEAEEQGGTSSQPADRVAAHTYLTLLEAADATDRNVELLRRWCVAGRIHCQRRGRDWFIARADLREIELLPRRGVSRPTGDLADRSTLNADLNRQIDDCLEPGEDVRVALLGVEDSALVATDRRVLLARDGVLVSNPSDGNPVAWDLAHIRRVQLDRSSSLGALVMTAQDSDDRAIVLLLSRPHLDRAEAAADALRGLLEKAGSYEPS